jgi:hypothetical protein
MAPLLPSQCPNAASSCNPQVWVDLGGGTGENVSL